MRGDIVRNRLRGGQEWRKSGAEETVIAGCIGNGKDWMRQEVRVEERRARHAEVKAASSRKKKWGLGSRAQGGSSATQERRSQNDKGSCWSQGGGDEEVLSPLSPPHEKTQEMWVTLP